MKTSPITLTCLLFLTVFGAQTACVSMRSGYEASSRTLVASSERLTEFVRHFHHPRPSRVPTRPRFVRLDSKAEIVFREDTPEIAPWSHDLDARHRKIVYNEPSGIRASIRVIPLADAGDVIVRYFACDYWLSDVVRIDNVGETNGNQSLRVRTICCGESEAGFTETRYYLRNDFRRESSGYLVQWTVEFLDSVPTPARQGHIKKTYADFEIVSSEVLLIGMGRGLQTGSPIKD